jgi:hypothetical protein
MPPRKTPAQAFMDSLLEMGVDSLRDTIQDAFNGRGIFDPQTAQFPQAHRLTCHTRGCGGGTSSICMSCKKPYCARHSEWRRADGFVICHMCFQYLWHAGREAAGRGGWEAFQQANGRYATAASPPPPPPSPSGSTRAARPVEQAPWEVLGIEADATEEQIKKAFRAMAAKSHPDTVPAEEREAAKEAFIRASNAYDAMLAALKASKR